MTDNGTERILGKLLQSVDDLRNDIGRLEGKFDAKTSNHDGRLSAVEGHINRQKGGWMAITGLTALSGTLGGIVAKFWHS